MTRDSTPEKVSKSGKVSAPEKAIPAPQKPPEPLPPKFEKCISQPFQFSVTFTDLRLITFRGIPYHGNIVGDNDVIFDVILSEKPREYLEVKLKRTSQRMSDVLICNCRAELITLTHKFEKLWFAPTTLVAGLSESSTIVPMKSFWLKYSELILELRDPPHSLTVFISGIAMYKKESTIIENINSHLSTSEKDVTLQVGNKAFRAHKWLLSARSPVFKAMFETNTNENIVTINDMEPDLFEEVLNYIYTDTCPRIMEKAFYLLFPAARFDLEDLKLKCGEELMKQVNPNTVSVFIMKSAHSNSNLLYQKCLDYLHENITEVFLTKTWELFKKSREIPFGFEFVERIALGRK